MRTAALLVALALVSVGPVATTPPPGTIRPAAFRDRIVRDHIPYSRERKTQMAAYSRRHYGKRVWRLRNPKVLVLHFTAGSSYEGARGTFASNTPNRGESPGVCSHYIVDKDGTAYEVVPPTIRCRHAIGINYTAIGIEMVQEAGESSHWADQQILNRRPQIRSALKLARYLRVRFDIKMGNVIGHAMANNSPYFRDLEGWRNDHTDWQWQDVREFRRRLRRIS